MRRMIRSRHQSAGHTLIEMLLSLVILSMVMASVTSAVLFASSASPDEDSFESTIGDDSQAMARIAEDLSVAKYLVEQTKTSITIVVSDRTGNGNPDRIRYAWSGTYGDPLTYAINDEEPFNLIDAVAVFDLGYTEQTQQSEMPVATYRGNETVLDSYTTVSSGSTVAVRSGNYFGQMVTLSLSNNAVGFMPTRVELFAEAKPPDNGTVMVQLRDRSNSAPGQTVYGTKTLDEILLTDTGGWNSFSLADTSFVEAGQNVAIVFNHVTGSNEAMEASLQSTGGLLGLGGGSGGYLTSTDNANWSLDNGQTFVYRLYGREVLTDPELYTANQKRQVRMSVSLQSVSSGRSPIKRAVQMMLAPYTLEAFAETEFDTDPTTMDLDADNNPEWSHDSGAFPAHSLSDGLWTCDGKLVFQPDGLSTADIIQINARMRSNDTLGPTIYGPYTINADGKILPIQTQLRSDGSGGQELVIYNDATMSDETLVLGGLPSGLVDIGLVLIPDENYLCISINNERVAAILLDRFDNPGTIDQAIEFGSSGGVAEFDLIDIKIGGTYTVGDASGGLIIDIVDLLF